MSLPQSVLEQGYRSAINANLKVLTHRWRGSLTRFCCVSTMCAHVPCCGGQRMTLGITPQNALRLGFFETGSRRNPRMADSARMGLAHRHLPSLGFRMHIVVPCILQRCLSSGSQACAASTLATESSSSTRVPCTLKKNVTTFTNYCMTINPKVNSLKQ